MRITRMRAAVAGVLGTATIALASPALAETPEPSPTATATATATAVTQPSPSPLVADAPTATPKTEPLAGVDPTVGPTGPAGPTATPSLDPSATPSATPTDAAALIPGATADATSSASPTNGTGNPTLDGFLDLLPFEVPLDKQINSIDDMDVNPLFLTFTCDGSVPSWKLKNTADKAFGFGWFDTSLHGGILDIGPKQTVDVPSKALAVIGSPWDAKTKVLLVTVPTVGVSNCTGGSAPLPLAPPAPLPVAVPAATSAVPADPHYTR
ncbi:hypothetical protein [Frankia sp. CcWB3]